MAQVPGLVAAYGFNEGSGSAVADASGNNNNGALGPGVSWSTQGRYGNALVFNGTSGLVTIPDAASLRLASGMTLQAWVNPAVVNNAWRDVIYKGNDNYFLEATSTQSARPAGGSTFGEVLGTAALAANTWTHLALTYDQATLRLYVNGVQVSSLARTVAIATSTNPLQIGGDSIYGQYFQGRIDEVRVYNRALTQAEIQADMNAPVGGPAPPSDTIVPTVAITAPTSAPTYTSASSPLALGGSASDNVGVTQVSWSSNRGGSGTASGTTAWSVSGIVLQPGTNILTVTARDAANNIGSDTLTVTYTAPDTTAPTVAITAPTSAPTFFTNGSPLTLGGTASDNVGVSQVSWSSDRGGSGTASGTSSWSVSGIALQPGANIVTVTARDAANNAGTAILTVTYDVTAPTVSMTAPANGATVSGTITLTANASDNLGVVGVQFLLDGAALGAERTTAPFSLSWATNSVANGAHTLSARARDAAGNITSAANVSVTVSNSQALGLVAAYGFNEGSGSAVADASGNANNGTLGPGVSWSTQGRYGNTLVFNGTSGLVTIPDAASLRLASGMTLQAWVNPAVVNNAWRDVIYKGDDNYFLEATSTQSARPAGGGTFGEVLGTAALAANTWTHLALTYDQATLRLYVNGVQVSSLARTAAIATSGNPLQFGGDSLYGQYFQGLIDEVRVYNRALTQAEIQADMNAPVGGPAPPSDTIAPTVAITAPTSAPTYTSASSPLTLGGSASDNVGVTQVSWSSDRGGSGTASGTTAWSVSGIVLQPGTNILTVTARDAANNIGSDTLTVTYTAPDTTPPTAPTNLAPTVVGTSQINLSWTAATDNVGVTAYALERCQGAGCTTFAPRANPTGTTYSDSGLAPSTTYRYRVRATDAAGNLGPYSNVAEATTQALDAEPPTAPGTLTATAASGTQINLGWGAAQDNVGVVSYIEYRCQGTGCADFVNISVTPATPTMFSDTGLLPNTSYSYFVRAVDAVGNLGPASNIASVTTLATVPELVAAYSFEEGAGTGVADASGRGNHGTLQNATWTTAGKYGKALVFNGSNALVTIPDAASLRLTTGMTLEVWVNPSTVPAVWRDVIYKGNDNYFLEATSTQGARPAGGGTFGEVFGTAALVANTWTHLALTYDQATLRLYVNGVQVSSVARTGAIATSANPLQIGGDSLYGQYFHGIIDEVRIYNVARTPTQILADANTPIGSVNLPVVSLAPSSISFGNQQTNTTSDPQIVTLTNTGDASLTISSLAVVGAHSADFNQGNSCGTTVAAGSSCFISVTFTPSANGARTATLRIADNAPGSPHTIPLAGTGAAGVVISPAVTVLTSTNQTQQFSASPSGVTWSVDGVAGGTAASGTITATGLYTAPPTIGAHTVTATTLDQLHSGNATVYVSGYAGKVTHLNDNMRTGRNLNETVLKPANVNVGTFGKLFSYQLDGVAHASPLYVAGVSIPGLGLRNVVYVATEHNSVYAFDGDGGSGTPLWRKSFINPAAGVTTVPADDTQECCDIAPEVGITGTPVIDPVSRTLYVVAKTKEVAGSTTNYVQRLHALDLATGAEKFGGPVLIDATVPGTGVGSQGGQLRFNPLRENQRAALLLSNGVVFIAFASHGDNQPYHGWLLGYHATTLQQVMVLCTSPNGEGAGVWMSNGPATDATGNVYFSTGDGSFNPAAGSYGDSVIKINPVGTVLDYFTPFDQAAIDSGNHDFGSGGPLLLPDQPGAHPHLLITAGKDESVYLLDRDNLGHFTSDDRQVVQVLRDVFLFGTPEPGNYSAPVYFNGAVYFSPVAATVKVFPVSSGLLSSSPSSQSATSYPFRGGMLAISADGTANGILWAVEHPGPTTPGVLRAYDPSDLAIELYNSNQAGTRDALGVAGKFSVPLVANGKVFVGGASQLVVYGLLP